MKKRTKVLLIIVTIICLLVIINFIPTFYLETSGMTKIEGKWINLYYEKEKDAAKDVFEFADEKTENIAKKLGFENKENVNIYVYDSQKKMQTKKYGIFPALLGLEWYIGDNIGTNVILMSPVNTSKDYDYNTIKEAVAHEIVHAYISVKNPKICLWLNQGMALYLSNGTPIDKEVFANNPLPSFKDTKSNNPIRCCNANGYIYANIYIEYIIEIYGIDKLDLLLETEDYEKCFNKTDKEIYDEWVNYLNRKYK